MKDTMTDIPTSTNVPFVGLLVVPRCFVFDDASTVDVAGAVDVERTLVFYTLVNRPHNNCNFPVSLFRLPLLTSLEHMLSQISPTTSSRYQITYNHTNTKSLP